MAEVTLVFNDAIAYERFMGQWSRAVGSQFLSWMDPPAEAAWLEVGCGTGVFTELFLQQCRPRNVAAIDPSPEQIAFARSRGFAKHIAFDVADAQDLPFQDAAFEVVVSALVLNFVPDRSRALREMRRVGCPGALVAAYVWNFAGRQSPNALGQIAREFGLEVAPVPGAQDSTLEALSRLFGDAGFVSLAATRIDIEVSFPNFDEFWGAQLPSFSPLTRTIARLSAKEEALLRNFARAALPTRPDGSIHYPARAHAIKGLVP